MPLKSERMKMEAGEWYCCIDPELNALRNLARLAVHAHNSMPPNERGAMAPELRVLFAEPGNAFIESPFHCAYGMNIKLGDRVYINADCVILDTALVSVGDGTMFGPAVQIWAAYHHWQGCLDRRRCHNTWRGDYRRWSDRGRGLGSNPECGDRGYGCRKSGATDSLTTSSRSC
jgi:hypothetical protein